MHHSNSRNPLHLWTLCLSFACLGVTLIGCGPNDEMLDYIESDIARTKVDDLTRAMDFVTSEVRFQQSEFNDQVMNGLNRWVGYSQERLDSIEWEADPFAKPLLEQYASVPSVARLDEFNYLNTDPYYIQQSYWLTQTAARLQADQSIDAFEMYRLAADNFKAEPDSVDPASELFQKLNPDVSGDEDLHRLVTAFKVFDWVCRNVQLVSDTPLTEDEADERRLNPDAETKPEAGVPGLGYQRYPYQVMMYGVGDYVERGKVMILLLRYLNVDAVMLTAGEGQRPWVVGVPIEDDFLLFDPKLALAVPGKQPGSVATLSEVRENPELLTSLDLTTDESLADETDYWVRSEDLESVNALVYASPESMSRRMAGLEQALVGDNRLLISYGMSDVAQRLPQVDGVTAQPWDIAFQTEQYRQAIRFGLEQSSDVLEDRLQWYYLTEGYIDGFLHYRTARGRFFKGKFQTDPEANSLNALNGWQRLIYDEDQIASLGTDPELQSRHGIRKEGQDAKAFNSLVASVQGQMRLIRTDAKFFLSQCLFDNGNENAAGSWLEDLHANPEDDRWNEGVTYLLGRSYESRKEYDRAIESYDDDELVQSHGNLLRARMLKELIAKYYPDVAQPEAE